nr:unnamed protein product [Naegleria fowleri]
MQDKAVNHRVKLMLHAFKSEQQIGEKEEEDSSLNQKSFSSSRNESSSSSSSVEENYWEDLQTYSNKLKEIMMRKIPKREKGFSCMNFGFHSQLSVSRNELERYHAKQIGISYHQGVILVNVYSWNRSLPDAIQVFDLYSREFKQSIVFEKVKNKSLLFRIEENYDGMHNDALLLADAHTISKYALKTFLNCKNEGELTSSFIWRNEKSCSCIIDWITILPSEKQVYICASHIVVLNLESGECIRTFELGEHAQFLRRIEFMDSETMIVFHRGASIFQKDQEQTWKKIQDLKQTSSFKMDMVFYDSLSKLILTSTEISQDLSIYNQDGQLLKSIITQDITQKIKLPRGSNFLRVMHNKRFNQTT